MRSLRDYSPIATTSRSFSEVLAAAQHRNGWAFKYLFSTYSGRLAAYAEARGSANPEAIANAALYEAFQTISATPDDEDAFACQLFRHTRQKLIEEEDRLAAQRSKTGDEESAEVVDLRSANNQRLHRVLGSLDSEHRDVVLLRVLGDFTAAQTGVIINRPIHAVKVLQVNALREISDRLAEQVVR